MTTTLQTLITLACIEHDIKVEAAKLDSDDRRIEARRASLRNMQEYLVTAVSK
jgi:hypothetical protein